MKNKNKSFKFTQFEAEEILDALEERYNFLKSVISESPDSYEIVKGDITKSEDVKVSLVEMSLIHEIWDIMK